MRGRVQGFASLDRGRDVMDFGVSNPDNRRPGPRPQLARRDVLRGVLWLTLGVGAAPLFSACSTEPSDLPGEKAPYPLARPDKPVTLPLKDSNPPIKDGLGPETGGTFNILNYDQ